MTLRADYNTIFKTKQLYLQQKEDFMKKYIPVLRRTQLFAGVGDEEILAMLDCLQVKAHSFRKGEYVFRQGEHIDDICILAEGRLSIQRDDYWGNRSIINMVETGEMFGEAYAAPGSEVMMNDVAAVEDSAVLFFNVKKILTTCSSACRFHSLVVQNLFFAISEKNRKLMRKLTHMSKRTTRKSCFPIFPMRRKDRADLLLRSRSTASSLRISSPWTAAPCPANWGKCGTKGY